MGEGPGGLGGQRRKGETLYIVPVKRQPLDSECYTATGRTRITLVYKCTPYLLSSDVAGVLHLSDD